MPKLRLLSLLGATLFVAAVTLAPQSGPTEHHVWPFEEIVPALEHPLDLGSGVNLIGNLLLFMPFGAALASLRVRFAVSIAIGCVFSAWIEIAQHFIPGRTSATDDILLNTLGTAAGYLLALRASRRVLRSNQRRELRD